MGISQFKQPQQKIRPSQNGPNSQNQANNTSLNQPNSGSQNGSRNATTDTSRASHISLSAEDNIALAKEDPDTHPVVQHIRRKYHLQGHATSTAFQILSIDEQDYFELDVKTMIRDGIPFTRYEWPILQAGHSKGHLVVYIMHHDSEGPVLINTFPRIKRPDERPPPVTPSRSATYAPLKHEHSKTSSNVHELEISIQVVDSDNKKPHTPNSENGRSRLRSLSPSARHSYPQAGGQTGNQKKSQQTTFNFETCTEPKETDDVIVINSPRNSVTQTVISQLVDVFGKPISENSDGNHRQRSCTTSPVRPKKKFLSPSPLHMK